MKMTPTRIEPDLPLDRTYGPDFHMSGRTGIVTHGHGPRTEAVEQRREESIAAVAAVLDASDAAIAQMTPREQAEAAYTPGGMSVDELEDQIRARRGMTPRDRGSDR